MDRRRFMQRLGGVLVVLPFGGVLASCDDDEPATDTGPGLDSGVDGGEVDSGTELDSGGEMDSGTDSGTGTDAGEPDAPATDAPTLACTENIATNHGHTLTVPEADVLAGAQQTYTLTIGTDHMHMVTLTAGDMTTLAGGGSVMVDTTIDASATFGNHSHSVTVTCA